MQTPTPETPASPAISHSNESAYVTQNLYEAAFLFARGFALAGVDRKDLRKVALVFKPALTLHESVLEFYNGGTIGALDYADAYRSLKDLVFQRL